jgi:hypothetical protein
VIYYFSIEWENLLTVEGLLEFGATRRAIRKNKYPVTAFVCRAPRGLHADWCCNASEDNVFDAPFFEQVIQIRIGKGIQSPFSRDFDDPFAELTNLSDCFCTLGPGSESACFLYHLQNADWFYQFAVTRSEYYRGIDYQDRTGTQTFDQVDRIGDQLSRSVDYMMKDAIRGEVIVFEIR